MTDRIRPQPHGPASAPTAADLDARDPLAGFAAEFHKPPGMIYLDGNSLGLLCKPAEAALYEAVESWRTRAILGWTEGPDPWFEMSRKAARMLAPLLGADPADVMVGQSTTVNLHQLLATYYDPTGPAPRILIDEWCFPSDRYAVESHLRLRGRDPEKDLVVVPDRDICSRRRTFWPRWTRASGWPSCRRSSTGPASSSTCRA